MPGVLLQIGKALPESLKSRRCVLPVNWDGGYQGLRFNVPLLRCPAPSMPQVLLASLADVRAAAPLAMGGAGCH